VVEPSGPAYKPLVERFGTGILSADGAIDRKALAALAFSDPEQLAALNAVTHPVIGAEMLERRQSYEGSDRVVLLDIPLLRAVHREVLNLHVVVVVDCPVDVAIERLVSQRGFDLEDAKARMAAQMSREERVAGADFVVDNSDGRDELVSQVETLWADLVQMEQSRRKSGEVT